MKILAIERENEGGLSEHSKLIFNNEALKVWEFYKKGIIREIYFTEQGHNAVIMLECENGKEAEDFLNQLPLVKEGIISFTVMPLTAYDGFERLFTD